MESIYKLPLILTPQPEVGFTVTCPILPELVTEGETARQALENATDALAAIIEAYEDLNRPMPPVLRQASTEAPIWLETALVLREVSRGPLESCGRLDASNCRVEAALLIENGPPGQRANRNTPGLGNSRSQARHAARRSGAARR